MGLVGIEKCIFIPSGGALGLHWRRTRAVQLGPLIVLGCFGSCFWASLYTLCVPRGIGGLGFLSMLEAPCAVLVYLKALWRFFFGI
jgi:hypothetical protein